jgi:predicted nucleic acid-binding protein
MRVIRSIAELSEYIDQTEFTGCLADTGFLYAMVYDDDRLYRKANDVLDILSDNAISIFANVVSRMEFIDLIFRKQVTQGVLKLFDSMSPDSKHKILWNLLKNIRDQITGHQKDGLSYKVDEARIKKFRAALAESSDLLKWEDFCSQFIDDKLLNEWKFVEQDLGLNFIEIMDGQTSEYFETPLSWSEMVSLMGKHGLRGPDAMIANLFMKSTFQLLVTNDSDFQRCLENQTIPLENKVIFLL